MASRDVTNYNTVTNVVAEQDNSAKLAAELGKKVIQVNQEARITEGLSGAQLELSKLTNQYQIDNEADPFNEDALKGYKEAQQDIITKYGENISPIFRRDWQAKASEVTGKENTALEAWSFKQTNSNSLTSLKNAMDNHFTLANSDGMKFGQNASSDVMAAINYVQSKSELEEFGNRNVGSVTTQEQMKKYKEDYAKSFIAGVAETNPQKAAKILDDEKFRKMFTTEQRSDMVDVIKKTAKKQELQTSLTQTVNSAAVTDIVNDTSKSYYDKRLEIDKLEFSGAVSSDTAAQARRVLTSQKELDAVTSTPVIAEIVTSIYDLNAVADTNAAEYLEGVKNIQNRILEEQALGNISATDVTKLNNQMKTLTSAKMADATKAVGYDFYDANEKFTKLPPEYRGTATRQLFYDTVGQELTPEQYTTKANKIIDDINVKRRADAMKVVNRVTSDDNQFLKSKGYTNADVAETARKYGITEAEVIKRLRSKQ